MLRSFVTAASVAMLCATIVHAAERSATPETTTHALVRSGSTIAAPATDELCDLTREEARKLFALSKTSGTARWICRTDRVITVTYGPMPVCPALPPPEGRVVQCPPGTAGAFTQTRSYSAAPYPTCAVLGEWGPSTPPASCVPNDSDSDGVPDLEDECPTVHAAGGPNGCPATPPANQPPTISGSPPTSIETGRFYDAYVSATDPEGARITFALIGAPSWLRIEPSGRLWGTAPSASAVFSGISVTASDGVNTVLLPAFSITASGSAPTPINCVVSGWSAWTPAQCVAPADQTRTRTIVTPPSNGGTACPSLSESQSCPGNGIATLSWTPPTQNTDDSPLTNLAGFRISYGRSAAELTYSVDVMTPGATSYVLRNLGPGTWYFGMRALTSNGVQSASLSNVVSKSVQ